MLKNHGEERVIAVLRDASESLTSGHRSTPECRRFRLTFRKSSRPNSGCLRSYCQAAIQREGEWTQLSYSHHIGYGARRLAVLALGKAVNEFAGHCRILLATPRYAEAANLIAQAERVLRDSYEELLRKVQLMAQTVFKDVIEGELEFLAGLHGGIRARLQIPSRRD